MITPTPHRSHASLAFYAPAVVAITTVELMVSGHLVAALNAAGVTGGTPIAGLGEFVSRLKSNLIWVAVTVVSITVIAIGLLFLFGHSRAQDYAIKALLGAAIIASGSGIVA
jgi:hypothetical protein